MTPYSKEYCDHLDLGSVRSAREVVPLVIEFVSPRSVIDVGCGLGAWLSVFEENGVDDVCGVDGSWIDTSTLRIPGERFVAADLRKPIEVRRQFDLVVSLEVAEHLPEESASMFVSSLTRLGPVILFSAAAPFQGGLDHVNEQWPSYWANLFSEHDYLPFDCVREKVWDNDQVEKWYAQNTLFFVRAESASRYPRLENGGIASGVRPLSVIHPRSYLEARQHEIALEQRVEELSLWADDLRELRSGRVSLRRVLLSLPRLTVHAVKQKM
jgi:SAM-dependent methyltransferase